MHGFTRSVPVQAPPETVFDALVDLEQQPKYMPSVVRLEALTEPPVQVGSKWRETRRFRLFGVLPIRGSATIEVAEHDPPRTLTLVADDGCNHASYRFTVAPERGGGARITMEARCRGVGKYEGNEKVAARLARAMEKHDGNLLELLAAHLHAAGTRTVPPASA